MDGVADEDSDGAVRVLDEHEAAVVDDRVAESP